MIDFDLQRFAEDVGGVEPATNDNGGQGGTEPNTTILGGIGTQTNQDPAQPPTSKTDDKDDNTQGATVPEQYDFTSIIPEGAMLDETVSNNFSEIAKSCNLTQEQANKIGSFGIEYAQQVAQQIEAQHEQTIQGWAEQAKQELGGRYPEYLSSAGKAIEALTRVNPQTNQAPIPNLVNFLNETGVGNRIEAIQLLAYMGNLVGEDTPRVEGTGGVGGKTNLYPNTNWDNYK